MKTCSRCKLELPRSGFAAARRRADGLQGWCRTCQNAHQRDMRRDNPERLADRVARDRARHPERFAAYDQRQREAHASRQARRRAAASATQVELIDRRMIYERDEGTCGICNTHVPWAEYEMDHKVPLSKGGPHIPENVQVSHGICNRNKAAKVEALVGVLAGRT